MTDIKQVAAPEIHDGVSDSVQAWADAVSKGDLDAIRVLYGPETTAYGPSGALQLKGREANVENYAALFEAFSGSVAFDDTHYFWAGDTLTSFGLFELTLTPKAGGEPSVIKGRFSDVAIPVSTEWGEGWRYLIDQSSVPMN